MRAHDLVLMFAQLGMMLAVALVMGQTARRLTLPVVIGELAAGIVLGPTVFGRVAPDAQTWLFRDSAATNGRLALAQVGIVLFLFLVGLEMRPANAGGARSRLLWTASLGLIVPFALGCGLAVFSVDAWGPAAANDPVLFAFFLGASLAISGPTVISRVLADLELLRSPFAALVMRAAVVDDLVGWSVFVVILSVSGAAGNPGAQLGLALVASALLYIGARLTAPRVLHWARVHLTQPAGFLLAAVVLVLVAGIVTAAVGIDPIFGALLTGAALARDEDLREQLRELIGPFVTGVCTPLYIVGLGMLVDFGRSFDPGLVGLTLLVACAGKVAGASVGARLGQAPPREALAIGFAMNVRGAMGLILAALALQQHLVDERGFVALVCTALVTSLMGGPIISWLLHATPELAASRTGERRTQLSGPRLDAPGPL